MAGENAARDNDSAPDRRLTWDQCAIIILGVLVLGDVLLLALRKVYFAPPNLILTLVMRLIFFFGWVPALIVCWRLRPTGRKRTKLLLAVVILVVSFLACSFALGPDMPLLFGEVSTMTPLRSPMTCETETLGNHRVRYTCLQPTMFSTDTFVLEGREGSPFARLVEMETFSSD